MNAVLNGKRKIPSKKSGNRDYKSVWINIPSNISRDNSFSFTEREEVFINVEKDRIVINRIQKHSKIIKDFGF